LRVVVAYMTILLSLPLNGQISFKHDTIKIGEVIVNGYKNKSYYSGYKITSVDSIILHDYDHGNLADVLSENSHVYIKSYGMGGIATTSFRGTGASHTQITWNGVNINQPMLGQSDISLIPSGFMDDIQINYGGASMTLNSGGLGGGINIETKPVWKNEHQFLINLGIGSFGRYTGLAKVRTGTDRFQTVTRLFLQSSENNFRFLNYGISSEPVWERRKNAQVHQQGFMQELYLKNEKSTASARIWYQSSDRNLPETMVVQHINPGERQHDEFLRTMLNWDGYNGRSDYNLAVSCLLNRLNYFNNLASIESRNSSGTVVVRTGIEKPVGKKSKFQVSFEDELDVINSNNYDKKKTRNTASITAITKKTIGTRLGTVFLVRQIFNDGSFLIPDFSAGLDFKILNEKDYFLKGNISKNSKIPTLNDMYWVPGGNQELKNEYGFSYELTYEMNKKISLPLDLKTDVTLFRNSIRDMIQWQPGEFTYWEPENIQNVKTEGLEASLEISYSTSSFSMRLNSEYSFTKANDNSKKNNKDLLSGNQLMYVPKNQLNASLRTGYKNFHLSWLSNFTGRRYVSEDNSQYLPEYILTDIIAGVKMNYRKKTIDMNLKIENLLNNNYQTIAYHPMPGRSYLLSFIYQLIK
jgi:outer membrane cobalamin receptor